MFAPFKTGDKVRLRNGTSPIMVVEVDYFECASPSTCPPSLHKAYYHRRPRKGWYIRFQYFSSLQYEESRKWREADDFVFYDPQQETTTMALYQTKEEKPRFGTFLAKNSKGQMVLEMKGRDGDTEAFDPKDIEEVLPFTVQITKFVGGNETNPQTRDYEMEQGSVELEDVLMHLSTGTLWKVTALDTKKRNPSTSKNGFMKLEGKRI